MSDPLTTAHKTISGINSASAQNDENAMRPVSRDKKKRRLRVTTNPYDQQSYYVPRTPLFPTPYGGLASPTLLKAGVA